MIYEFTSLIFDLCVPNLFFIKQLRVTLRVEDVSYLPKYVVPPVLGSEERVGHFVLYFETNYPVICRVHEQLLS